MNKKGFVLVEAIMVMTIVVVSMLGLYTTSSKLLTRIKQYKKYDSINDVYKLSAIKDIVDKEISDAKTAFNGASACSSNGIETITGLLSNNANIKKVYSDGTSLGFTNAYIVNTYCLNLSSATKSLNNYLKTIDRENNYVYLVIEYLKDEDYNYASLVVDTSFEVWAVNLGYDNTITSLPCNDVQCALDKIIDMIE